MVALLRVPRTFSEKELRAAAEKVKLEVPVGYSFSPDLVTKFGPMWMMRIAGYCFHVIVAAQRYGSETEKFAESIKDLRLKRIVLENTAWFSADFLAGGPKGISLERKHVACARVVAELLGPECMGIYLPAKMRIYPAQAGLADKLRRLKSLKEFDELVLDPVVEFSEEQAAEAGRVARQKWPQFIDAFGKKNTDDQFFVKKRFAEGETVEFMWVRVAEIGTERVFGVLESKPSGIKGSKSGDGIGVSITEVEDWCYTHGGKMHGLFLKP